MPDFIIDSEAIQDVQIAKLPVYGDDRGSFREVFKRNWFPQVSWENLQSNCSHSRAGVLRGLHYHFNQVDYWFVTRGTINAGLVDLRPNSPTYGASQLITLSAENNTGLFIPIGVGHGFYGVTDCTLLYFVNNYYDNSDEFGVAWNDPAIGLDWGSDTPIVSDRDTTNPLMADIPSAAIPKPYG